MRAEQIIIIFYITIFIFRSMYLVLFSILLNRTIVTVYTDNIFIYNYLLQMHQLIHLSPVGCCTPARGKTVQKNRAVSGIKFSISYTITLLDEFVHVGNKGLMNVSLRELPALIFRNWVYFKQIYI